MHRFGRIVVVALSLALTACTESAPKTQNTGPTGKGRIVVEGSANQQASP